MRFQNALSLNYITSLSASLTRSNFNQPTVLIEQSSLPRDGGNDITAPSYLFKAQHSWSAFHSTGFVSETRSSMILPSPGENGSPFNCTSHNRTVGDPSF